MTGFEPGSSGIRSDHSANCATTTAQVCTLLDVCIKIPHSKGTDAIYKR